MADDDTTTSEATADEPTTTDQPAADGADAHLGDAGKRALQALRSEMKDLRAELKRYQAQEADDDSTRDAGDDDGGPSESTRDAASDDDGERVATTAEDVEPKPQPRRFQGTGDGGAMRQSVSGGQPTRDQLKGMSAAAITRARRDGQLRDALRGDK